MELNSLLMPRSSHVITWRTEDRGFQCLGEEDEVKRLSKKSPDLAAAPAAPPSSSPRNFISSQVSQFYRHKDSTRDGAFASSAKEDTQYSPLPEAVESSRWRESIHAGAGYLGAEWWAYCEGVRKAGEGMLFASLFITA
jgi:hypothetical protein